MYSKEFMSFLATYGEEENVIKKAEETREIEFRDNLFKRLAYATVSIKK